MSDQQKLNSVVRNRKQSIKIKESQIAFKIHEDH